MAHTGTNRNYPSRPGHPNPNKAANKPKPKAKPKSGRRGR